MMETSFSSLHLSLLKENALGLLINNNLISGCSKYKPCDLNIAQSAKCSYEKKTI